MGSSAGGWQRAQNGGALQQAGDGEAELGADAQNQPSGVVNHPSGLPDEFEAQALGPGVEELGRQGEALHGHKDVVRQISRLPLRHSLAANASQLGGEAT